MFGQSNNELSMRCHTTKQNKSENIRTTYLLGNQYVCNLISRLCALRSISLLKILPPPALVHQPDQVFWAKKKHNTRQPLT